LSRGLSTGRPNARWTTRTGGRMSTFMRAARHLQSGRRRKRIEG
jgi:hypothetical protein